MRTSYFLALIVLAIAAQGCRTCANTHDYCGPTELGGHGGICGGCDACQGEVRMGSILSGGMESWGGGAWYMREGEMPVDEMVVPEEEVLPGEAVIEQ